MINNLKNFTLLYVEDEVSLLHNMIEYFESYFKTVYIASNGTDALKLYKKHKVDVAILDINIPNISGLEVAKRIRLLDAQVKIIMLTAHSEVDILLQATELNLSKYLLKPVSPFELNNALDKISQELMLSSRVIVSLGEETFFCTESHTLTSHKTLIELSLKEERLLSLFITKKNICVTFEDIMAYVWNNNFTEDISRDSVKSQVNYLRKKIPKNLIESVNSKGYTLNLPKNI